MKRLIVSVMVAICMAVLSLFCMSMQIIDNAQVVRKECKVSGFTAIEMDAVGNIVFVQGDKYSLTLEGSPRWVAAIKYRVEDNCLKIDMNREKNRMQKGVNLYITAPDLKKVEFDGVGNFNCDTPLKVDEFDLEFDGVGNIKITDLVCRRADMDVDGVGEVSIRINCDELKAGFDGVGNVTLSGSAKKADIDKARVGRVNLRGDFPKYDL